MSNEELYSHYLELNKWLIEANKQHRIGVLNPDKGDTIMTKEDREKMIDYYKTCAELREKNIKYI